MRPFCLELNMTKIDEFLQQSIVADTETTGVESEDDIIELSASLPESASDDIDTMVNYTQRYKPLKDVPPEASAVHFITTDELKDCGSYKDDLKNIDIIFGSRQYYIGHNVQFDRRMMTDNEYKYRNSVSQYLKDDNKWICTLRLAKKLFAEDKDYANLTLSYLWFKLGCDKTASRKIIAHSAKDDVFMCCQVLIKMIEVAIQRGHIDPNSDIGPQVVNFCNMPMRYTVMPFGKHKGEPMHLVPLNYIEWMIKNSDILDESNPNYDRDFAYTMEYEYSTRVN